MKVKVQVAFVVESDELLEVHDAQYAAKQAVFHNLALVDMAGQMMPAVDVHVDGVGKCEVSLLED